MALRQQESDWFGKRHSTRHQTLSDRLWTATAHQRMANHALELTQSFDAYLPPLYPVNDLGYGVCGYTSANGSALWQIDYERLLLRTQWEVTKRLPEPVFESSTGRRNCPDLVLLARQHLSSQLFDAHGQMVYASADIAKRLRDTGEYPTEVPEYETAFIGVEIKPQTNETFDDMLRHTCMCRDTVWHVIDHWTVKPHRREYLFVTDFELTRTELGKLSCSGLRWMPVRHIMPAPTRGN